MTQEDYDRLVREPERARITGVSRAHWAALERQNEAPKRVLVGARSIAWRLSDLMRWLDQRAAVADTPEARARRAPPLPSYVARRRRKNAGAEGAGDGAA